MGSLAFPHLQQEPLSKHTTFRIGGPAEIFALPKTKEDLFAIGKFLHNSGKSYFLLGKGSNVLASDDGFQGVVICTDALEPFLEFLPDGCVRASASSPNARLLRACAEQGLGGIEYLSGVPGNLGGAVFMNAGTSSGWIEQALESVEVVGLEGAARTIYKKQLQFSYREQHFLRPGEVIVAATLKLNPEPRETVLPRLAEASRKRKEAQPIELPSCGSVFRNPPNTSAWKLIHEVGLKGHQVGGARFHPKHCNFITNEGGATQKDVLTLIQLAKEKVLQQTGVSLQEEVILIKPKWLNKNSA